MKCWIGEVLVDTFLIASKKLVYKLDFKWKHGCKERSEISQFQEHFPNPPLLGYCFDSKPHLLDHQVQPYLNIMKTSDYFFFLAFHYLLQVFPKGLTVSVCLVHWLLFCLLEPRFSLSVTFLFLSPVFLFHK